MEQDPLIAYRLEDVARVASILFLVTFMVVVAMLKRQFESNFFVDSILSVALFSAAAITLLTFLTLIFSGMEI